MNKQRRFLLCRGRDEDFVQSVMMVTAGRCRFWHSLGWWKGGHDHEEDNLSFRPNIRIHHWHGSRDGRDTYRSSDGG